jgi:hypothetical protein
MQRTVLARLHAFRDFVWWCPLQISCWDHESLLRDNLIGRAVVDISALLRMRDTGDRTNSTSNSNNDGLSNVKDDGTNDDWVESQVLVYHQRTKCGADRAVPLRVLKQAKDTLKAIGSGIHHQFGSSSSATAESDSASDSDEPPETPLDIDASAAAAATGSIPATAGSSATGSFVAPTGVSVSSKGSTSSSSTSTAEGVHLAGKLQVKLRFLDLR